MSRLGPLDAAWLHMERPDNPMSITAVLWFDEGLTRDALLDIARERLVGRWPRFRQRVVEPRGPGGPRWEDDPAFRLERHVVVEALPAPGGRAELQDRVSELAGACLDRSHPPWELRLVEGFAGGCAVVARLHHCIADGIALARVLLALTDGSGELPPSHPAVRRRGWERGRVARVAAEAVDAMADTLADPELMREVLELGVEGIAELARLATLPPDADTPLRRPLSGRKRVAWADPVALDRVKAAGRAFGCTVNDVLASAMAGAVGAYLRDLGCEAPWIRTFVPVNLRPLDRPVPVELGNLFSMVVLELPVGERDPVRRLRAVHARMERLKAGVEPAITHGLFQALGRTPARVDRWIAGHFGRRATAVFSNVPGPRRPVRLGAVALRGVMVWVPQVGPMGVGLSVISYAGRVWAGVSADAACLPEPVAVARRFPVAVDELVAAAG